LPSKMGLDRGAFLGTVSVALDLVALNPIDVTLLRVTREIRATDHLAYEREIASWAYHP